MLELSSVHIPKSAGTSFLAVLRGWYGAGLSLEYHCNGTLDGIQPWTRAIHGHFKATEHEAERLITWMREPAKRVASHYYYWKVTAPVARVDPLHVAVIRNELSLLEFADHPEIRNLTASYMDGLDLDAFDFVGISESIAPETGRLARILEMPVVSPPRRNATASPEYMRFRASVDYERTMAEIRRMNAIDVDLYAQAHDRMTGWWQRFAA